MVDIKIPEQTLVDVDKLHVDGDNPNRMDDIQHKRLKTSIMTYGFIVPIITNKDLLIADGEQRWTVAKSLNMTQVPVIRLPVEDVDRRLLRQVLNKLRGEHDLTADALEFEKIIEAGRTDDLKHLLDLNDNKLEKYLQELKETKLEPQGLPDLKDAKILNLYAGIGGNRKFWGELDITAVEYNKEIASCYQEFYPTDTVIVEDAHTYLEKHFSEYDFIWTSPPCPTHSRIRKNLGVNAGIHKPIYPDLKLYEEILFLEGYFEGKYVVENVISWYNPLIEPQERGRHYFWANFNISEIDLPPIRTHVGFSIDIEKHAKDFQIDLEKIPKIKDYPREKILSNCVHPLLGEHILKCAYTGQKAEKINS